MDPIYRQFMVRRLAAVKQRRCYIEIFKLIVEHKVAYTVNMNGRLLQSVVSVRRVGAADRRDHQEVRGAEATAGIYLCITTVGLSCAPTLLKECLLVL